MLLKSGLDGGRFFGDVGMRVDVVHSDRFEVLLSLDEVRDLVLISEHWQLSVQAALLKMISTCIEEGVISITGKEP